MSATTLSGCCGPVVLIILVRMRVRPALNNGIRMVNATFQLMKKVLITAKSGSRRAVCGARLSSQERVRIEIFSICWGNR